MGQLTAETAIAPGPQASELSPALSQSCPAGEARSGTPRPVPRATTMPADEVELLGDAVWRGGGLGT